MNLPSCPSREHHPDESADTFASYADLVRRVREGDASGMADLYQYISGGLRPYLSRQLRPQDYHDKIHNILVDLVVAIRRGQVRYPERLMGFARTIARRHVSGYIQTAVANRRQQVAIESVFWIASPHETPEDELISREQIELLRWTLASMSRREGEVLSRFYVQEQSQQQICLEMGLTHTQYRLLKWRSKAHFERLRRKQTAGLQLRTLCASSAH